MRAFGAADNMEALEMEGVKLTDPCEAAVLLGCPMIGFVVEITNYDLN